jgi:hypothetical protein
MPHLKHVPELVHQMMDLLTPAVVSQLNIGAVHYGDQDRLVAQNTVCFEPDIKVTELTGANRLVSRTFRVYVFIYTAAVTSTEMNREQSDQLASDLEDIFNAANTLGDTVLHCMVTANESGYSTKSGSIVRSARLTFEATTRDRLP